MKWSIGGILAAALMPAQVVLAQPVGYEEALQAAREDKTLGLLAVLNIWGPAALLDAIVEVRYGDRDVVQEWADEREKALIDENGGTLRDMNPTKQLHQTFNLQERKLKCRRNQKSLISLQVK